VTTVHVETAARLHFGVLDLRGGRGRWFGGIGAGAPGPTLEVSASHAPTITASGPDAERATEFATRFFRANGFDGGAAITVHRALPPHAGLGSGTQLALAVARALAELLGVDTDTRVLAHAVGRGRRSAIGTWTFDGGGLVVEGGKRRDSDGCGPLLARIPFPGSWRCVVAIPRIGSSLSGPAEASAIAQLPAPPEREVEQVSHLVLLSLLPALADADLAAFGGALTELQQITGQWWASVQGSVFAPGVTQALVQRMAEWGASGVGQSSWGPTVYGVVDGEAAGAALAARVRAQLGESGDVYEGPFRATGARVWRT
jgi:beta-ribofuranosylaminobenzene 5'-phosphate synthase